MRNNGEFNRMGWRIPVLMKLILVIDITHEKACQLFDQEYSDNQIIRSTVTKLVEKFAETESAKDLPRSRIKI